MPLRTTPEESDRPLGVYFVCLFYLFLEGGTVFYFVLARAGKINLSPELLRFYAELPLSQFLPPVVLALVMLFGIGFLFQMRPQAVTIFGFCFLFFFFITAYHLISGNYNSWFGFWGRKWLLISTGIKAAVLGYSLLLKKKDLLF